MPTPGNAIGQTVMQADDQPGASTFQSAHQRQVPQRMLPVHHGAEEFSSNSFQFRLSTMLERHFAHVTADIELGIVFPTGKPEAEGRGHDTLEIAGNQRQL